MKQVSEAIQDIKRDLLFHVILNMKRNLLSLEDTKYLAEDFLQIFPVFSIAELLKKLNELGKIYKEARIVFIKYANLYYEEEKTYLLYQIPPYIKNGEIDKAIEVMKGGIYHE